MAVFLVPFAVAALGGLGIIGGAVASREISKKTASDEREVQDRNKAALTERFSNVKSHQEQGEIALAVNDLKELIAFYKQTPGATDDELHSLINDLRSLTFQGQEEGRRLTTDYKVALSEAEHGFPYERYILNRDYVHELKRVLPEGDEFLNMEVSKFNAIRPPLKIN
ncbi:hypothetical protein [Pseudomonas trivialis]|uniref:Uncharacterized protein n=1 Tax=Pseudomonas trivialis TaxID=200450 RepID=A0A0R2ZI04_9PSED|nr:hypothetical protein [Pseudomonas trivialis]KRP59452.1 hypothetical protein TU79_14760 [Pseudomonas trivialis]SDR83441.1 hypothetical protein SAMN04490205_0586 [Pseudomonas trivialis]